MRDTNFHTANEQKAAAQLVAGAADDVSAYIYWSPCLGMPPVIVSAPLRYLVIQILVGMASLAVLLIWGGE